MGYNQVEQNKMISLIKMTNSFLIKLNILC